jgi:hypothetical protein
MTDELSSFLSKSAWGALLGAGVLALSTASGSAAIVCSGKVCWHTQERHEYPPGARVIVHPDDWRWRRREHYVWREHEGAGTGAAGARWNLGDRKRTAGIGF